MANEKRLIDANALVADLELLANHEDDFRKSVILGVVHTVQNRPTVDAVEVVRCKDCKHYSYAYLDLGYCKQEGSGGFPQVTWHTDDFCSYGERRNDENNS